VRQIADRRTLLLLPPIALAAMLLLGWVVGHGSTPLDDWFHHFRRTPARRLLVFTDPAVLATVLAAGVGVAMYRRRWRLVVVMLASPVVGIVLARLLKQMFGRENDGALAYPSGHTTVAVIVMGMIVLAAGSALWAVIVAVIFCLLAVLGQAVTYHYFTDTVGAVLLGTAVVGFAALVAELDTRQPRCDADHTGR
jgi:FtsH-binding integral membrane protein